MRTCSRCRVSKKNSDFLTVTGKFYKMCLRCRDVSYKSLLKRKKGDDLEEDESERDDREIEETPKITPNPEKSEKYCPKKDDPKNIPLRDFIDVKKKSIQKSLKGFSKSAMIKYFENIEPEIGKALELIESEELKDLIKIWMNEKYIFFMEESESELSEYE